MDLLRRVLLLQALVWSVCGVAIAVAPRLVLVSIFDLAPSPEYGYVRVAGIFSFSLALLMVLVARRLTEIWWFEWAFVVASGGSGIVAALTALFGLPDGASPLLWWLFAAASTTFAVGLLAGLAKTGTERPPF